MPIIIYVLLHFEHKNDITIIIKLFGAARLRLVAPYKVSQWLWCHFHVQNVIEHTISSNKYQVDRPVENHVWWAIDNDHNHGLSLGDLAIVIQTKEIAI